ncbi:hypothetical protein FVE85_3591 [Porphyridium purpureum]|uniref:Uncharacterized protein n=1 Tax=Porphyridium purpureum TaxID=35688 RepID=A0A5J4YN98_PORPP|nr:hypothetical protein FVE85_3591 [Porphyridium purpureum]|eukprot:POR7504..scf249_10
MKGLWGPFYAIRIGRNSFRGVLLKEDEYQLMLKGEKNPIASIKTRLTQAIDFCRTPKGGGCLTWYAFRHGKKGARGFVKTKENLEIIKERVDGPMLETHLFANATQAIVFCQQAGTSSKDWKKFGKSINFLSQNKDLSVPIMWSEFWVKNAERGAIRTGPIPLSNPSLMEALEKGWDSED